MSHPLICTERRILPRLLDTLFTLIAWVGFGWLVCQGLINVLQAQPEAGTRPLALNIGTISMYLLIALVNAMLLVLWARYNQRRFAVERRQRRDGLPDETLARLSGLPAERLQQMQLTRSMVVSHDADGSITEVRARDPMLGALGIPTLDTVE